MKIVVTILFISLSLASFGQSKMKFYEDTVKMKEEVMHFIPLGTDTAQAKIILKENKFEGITMYWDSEYACGKKMYSHLNFVYAFHDEGAIWCSLHWQVALVHQKGKIVDVHISYSTICL